MSANTHRIGMPAGGGRRRLLRLSAAIGLAAACAADAGAQGRVTVLVEPRERAVGLSVAVNAGSSWELESESGWTFLAALALLEQVRPRLDRLGVKAAAECGRTATVFTLLLPRTAWRRGAALFLDELFKQPLGDAAIERARTELLGTVRMDVGNPADELRQALLRARFGRAHRWARPPCGRVETLEAATSADIRRIARSRFLPSRATAAITGPVSREVARDLLRHALGDSDLPLLLPPPRSGRFRGRERLRRSTVTTFIGMAFPFDAGDATDVEALRMLAQRLAAAMEPGPARIEVYDVAVEVDRHGGGGALVVYLVTEPDHAARWARRVEDLVRRIGREPLPRYEFNDLVDRYRAVRLRELSGPHARARDAALQLFFDQEYRAVEPRLHSLTPDDLRRAAAALGRPVIAFLGPD